jgi:ATP-dependent DNA helicase RecQ
MGYDKLTTYGIMSDMPVNKIRRIMEFLVEKGYLEVTLGEYPVIRATELTSKIIREKIKLEMKLPQEKKKVIAPKEKTAEYPLDSGLLTALKELRMKIAAKEKVPAYIIFTDASLRDMCKKLPKDEGEFLGISGVGRKKCDLYGREFLEAIKSYTENKGKTSEKSNWTEEEDNKLVEDYNKGLSIMDMSREHKRKPNEIRVRLKELKMIV